MPSFCCSAVGCPDSADTIVDMMQMFRDKPAVFGKAAELLSKLITASADMKVSVRKISRCYTE